MSDVANSSRLVVLKTSILSGIGAFAVSVLLLSPLGGLSTITAPAVLIEGTFFEHSVQAESLSGFIAFLIILFVTIRNQSLKSGENKVADPIYLPFRFSMFIQRQCEPVTRALFFPHITVILLATGQKLMRALNLMVSPGLLTVMMSRGR